jgi:hypothetical protein
VTLLSDAEEFFYENAGFSYSPETETEDEGRRRCARDLAAAEAWARTAGIEFEWADDWEVDHRKEYDCYEDGGPESCEACVARLDDEIVASLGCIDDASSEYRRVTEAQLALEVMSTLPAT